MAIALLVVGGLGGILLVAAAVLLCVLNWSEKLWGPLIYILLGGTVTAIIAVASGLKEARIEQGFPTTVVFEHGLSAFLPFDPKAEKLSRRLSALASLGRPSVSKNGETTLTIKPATTPDAMFQYGSELLQYQLVHELETIQGRVSVISATGHSTSPTVSVHPTITRSSIVTGEDVHRAVQGNRFANNDIESFRREHGRIPRLPEGTQLRLIHEPPSPQTGPERRTVRLEKPWFFTVDLVVEPIGGSGPGILPTGITLPQERLSGIYTYHFKVLLRAKFALLTSGNWQTEEHKKWVEWLFSELREAMSD